MERAREIEETEEKQARRTTHAPINWRPVMESSHDIIDWAVDIALRQVAGLNSDEETVERARKTLHEAFDGTPPSGPYDQRDLLFLMGLFVAEVDLDCHIQANHAAVMEALNALTPVPAASSVRRFIAEQVWRLMPRWPVHCGCCSKALS